MDRYFASLDGLRGVLEIAGDDRRDFLQGLITNDVMRLAPDRALYAALLTAQGRYLHDFSLVEHGETFLLDGEDARLADLTRRLNLYKLRSKVTLKPASERWEVSVAFGRDALAGLDLPAEAGRARELGGGIGFVDPRLATLGARLILPRGTGSAFLRDNGFVAAGPDAYDRLRLSLGVPESGRDLMPEKSLLLESGFDELNGIDWNKGCYIGQELTARTKYRGLIKKRLMPVDVTGAMPDAGSLVMWGDDEAGEMRSGRDGIALALLRLDAVEKASAEVPLRAGEARLTAKKQDWAKF
jgi:folate-binding protein YgfZ